MADGGLLGQAAWRSGMMILAVAILAACSPRAKKPQLPAEAPVTAPVLGPSQLPADAQRHRIALLVPLTGPNAGVGESIANTANMAVLDTGGKALRVTSYDTATGAEAAARAAIADGNRLILGPLLADDVRAVAPIGRAARIPLISFSNDVSVAGQGTYLMGFVPTQSIGRIVNYARSKGVERFAGLAPVGLYGQRASQAFVEAVQSSGGKLVGIQSFERNPGAITAALRKLGPPTGYQALLVADSGRVALQIAPQVKKGNAATQILGTELWNAETDLASNPALRGALFASVSDALYSQLATKYRARFAKAPYRLSSLGYDSVLLINKVSRSWKPGTPFPLNALNDPGGFTGIDGAFRFGATGVAERMLEVQQLSTGATVIVSPAPRSFASPAGVIAKE